MDSGTSKDTRNSFESFSNSSSSCSSPRAKDNAISKEILMRSGGGLQGLLWSKYGLERGKESPLEKRRKERQGRRINSEPVNDLTAALKDSKVQEENRLRSQSACEVTAKKEAEKATSSQASFEIYDVLGNLTLDPSASLEKGEDAVELPSPSAKTDSPRSPAYQRFSRTDSFDVILSKRIMEKYKNMNMAEDGTLVSTDNSGEDAAERVN
ncbi:hypothetical protein HKI87_02g13070 [Chloropicon roscoffensis]|uniref:Uncharacterized protein n=1 Tax=Chloropicon roscoffensis TaxID=1461544 RepID=A0AAX4P1I8_9CHLO